MMCYNLPKLPHIFRLWKIYFRVWWEADLAGTARAWGMRGAPGHTLDVPQLACHERSPGQLGHLLIITTVGHWQEMPLLPCKQNPAQPQNSVRGEGSYSNTGLLTGNLSEHPALAQPSVRTLKGSWEAQQTCSWVGASEYKKTISSWKTEKTERIVRHGLPVHAKPWGH